MTTPDNSALTKWIVQRHGSFYRVSGPSRIPGCTIESYCHEHEQQAQWHCDALNTITALQAERDKLREECEMLRAACNAVDHSYCCSSLFDSWGERKPKVQEDRCDCHMQQIKSAARAAEGNSEE